MDPMADSQRYIYKTRGVCPPEIHFELQAEMLRCLRFVGGGCPGNAQLVARLLEGRSAGEVIQALGGIDCRNGTSCPDQLAAALQAALCGKLEPSASFRIENDPAIHSRIGLIAEPRGDHRALAELVLWMQKNGVDRIYCVGDLIGQTVPDRQLERSLGRDNLQAVLGPTDWRHAQGRADTAPLLAVKSRDFLRQLPHLASFRLGPKTGIAFQGEYLQQLPGYSDFEPFAVEINTVCGMTAGMQDESVFPALAAMTPQFTADFIIFSENRRWGHWHVAGKDFISIGPAVDNENLCWGLLEWENGRLRFDPSSTAPRWRST
jgi:uncharacterized protein (TIGR03905 family)